MKLVDFIECFDDVWSDIDVVLYIDSYIDHEHFKQNNYEYDLEWTGKMKDIPIGYAKMYMVNYETVIDWDNRKVDLYVRERKED